jgi:Na+/proline symporter
LWKWLPDEIYLSLDEVLPAILVSSLVLFIVSILTQEKESTIK